MAHELAHGQVAQQRARLEHRADGPARDRLRRACRRRPCTVPASGREQPEQHVDRRRLPGAVRPEQRDRLPCRDVEIDPADGLDRPLRVRYVFFRPRSAIPGVLAHGHAMVGEGACRY